MEKSLKLFLSLFISIGCNQATFFSKEEKIALAEEKWKTVVQQYLEDIHHIQGTAKTMKLIDEIIKLNPNHCDALRERSTPYLKRGMPQEWKIYFNQAVKCNSARWMGWRGYHYLYFFRDYSKAIADFDATDTLTPNHIDTPQGHSVDFWRGHAYLGAKNYGKSIYYYQKHIDRVTTEFGEDRVEPEAFLNMAIVHYENKSLDSMPYYLDKALYYYQDKSADSKYYYALYHKSKGDTIKVLSYIDGGIEYFLEGYYKRRPNYNEDVRQIYVEELIVLEQKLKNPTKR